jgi:O-antigen/teichoic acid export membrane protein
MKPKWSKGADRTGSEDAKPRTLASTIAKNSVANVVTGFSMALTTLFVPPVLARVLSAAEFGAWALILQIAGYTSFLSLGMQAAIGRYVAYYLERNDREALDSIVSTALMLLAAFSSIAIMGVVAASLNLQVLFPQMPRQLDRAAAVALCLIGGTLAVGLIANVYRGVLVGVQRNELVALLIAPSRAIQAAAMVVVALAGGALELLALAFACANLASYALLWAASRRLAIAKSSFRKFSVGAAKELSSYCGSTLVWSVAMLMTSGLDTAIVGRLNFSRVAVYSACLAPITILVGVQQAIFSPLLQVGAAFSARGASKQLEETFRSATRIGTVVLLLFVAPLFVFSHELLRLWLGPRYATQGTDILRLLLVANFARLLSTPYAVFLLATGEHRRVKLAPILEGITNVAFAIGLGLKFGAVGVACGAVIGAVTGALLNYFYNLPRTLGGAIDGSSLLRHAVLAPLLCFLPAVSAVPLGSRELSDPAFGVASRLVLLLLSLGLTWRFAISQSEKNWVMATISRRTV